MIDTNRFQELLKEYKREWLFPMIEEEMVYRQFFDECTHLSSWKI